MTSKTIYLSDPILNLNDRDSRESMDELLNSIRQLVEPSDFPDHIIDLNRPIETEKLNLSEKTVSESTHALSAFIHALSRPAGAKGVDEGLTVPYTDNPAVDYADGHAKKPSNGLMIEDLVAQCLKEPLNRWIADNQNVITDMLWHHIHQQSLQLVQQWLDQHLPTIIQESVDRHLLLLIKNASAKI
jgi:hypothetical protein